MIKMVRVKDAFFDYLRLEGTKDELLTLAHHITARALSEFSRDLFIYLEGPGMPAMERDGTSNARFCLEFKKIEEPRRQPQKVKPTPLEPFEKDDDIYRLEDFLDHLDVGMFTNDDGHGVWANKDGKSCLVVDLSNPVPPREDLDTIVWYNK